MVIYSPSPVRSTVLPVLRSTLSCLLTKKAGRQAPQTFPIGCLKSHDRGGAICRKKCNIWSDHAPSHVTSGSASASAAADKLTRFRGVTKQTQTFLKIMFYCGQLPFGGTCLFLGGRMWVLNMGIWDQL